MKLVLLDRVGFRPAMLGAMLSYGKTSFEDLKEYPFILNNVEERFDDLSKKLVLGGSGHDKFLEQMQYWIGIQAPLYWWKQFDTYRIGISKSSESTMHKSWKDGLTQDDFEGEVFDDHLRFLNQTITEYKNAVMLKDSEGEGKAFKKFINNLPDGYLQTRLVNINAKALRNIYLQRKNHKLSEWKQFCDFIKELEHGDLITLEK